MQNLVVFVEPSEDACNTPLKAGNMVLNRFCIDEDVAFELSGVNYLEKTSRDIILNKMKSRKFELKKIEKGKEFSFIHYSDELNLQLISIFLFLPKRKL